MLDFTGENREQLLFWLDGHNGRGDIVHLPDGSSSTGHVDIPNRDCMGFVSAYVVFDTAER
jgi:hypothetical protein